MNHSLRKSNIIIALGSSDTSIPTRAAELFKEDFAPYILFAGGFGKITKDMWQIPEAEKFAQIAQEEGVPESALLIEKNSTNTGENIQFSKELLVKKGIPVSTAIIVCKPYKERRDYATFKMQWPELDIIVTSPQVSFEEYMEKIFSIDVAMNLLVGDVQRMKLYAEEGYQIKQDIPTEVWHAYEKLVEMGYDKHLIKS